LKKLNELEEGNTQIQAQYVNPIENFPNKIDQLLDALNRVCLFCFREKFSQIYSF